MDFRLATPFGGRPLSVEMIEGQRVSASCGQDLSADKWTVLRDLRTCRHHYGLSDRAIAILSALLTFYKQSELSQEEGLIVYPSNKRLCERAHGISEPTLRRHLADLVKAGVLVRRDSPNGKRYARKDSEGRLTRAFGFDLTPLLALAETLHSQAEAKRADEDLKRALREDITLLRRDISKSLCYALEQDVSGPWIELVGALQSLNIRTDRLKDLADLKELHSSLVNLAQDVHNALDRLVISKNIIGNVDQTERHKQDSNTDYKFDSENGFPKKDQEEKSSTKSHIIFVDRLDDGQEEASIRREQSELSLEAEFGSSPDEARKYQRFEAEFDLSTILMACPKISHCLQGGVGAWSDLVEAAERAGGYLDISPSAMREAQNMLGVLTASATVAAIFERQDEIRSPGGYLRSLSGREGFTPKPMLQALLNKSLRAGSGSDGRMA